MSAPSCPPPVVALVLRSLTSMGAFTSVTPVYFSPPDVWLVHCISSVSSSSEYFLPMFSSGSMSFPALALLFNQIHSAALHLSTVDSHGSISFYTLRPGICPIDDEAALKRNQKSKQSDTIHQPIEKHSVDYQSIK
jgi:hypothetical protein